MAAKKKARKAAKAPKARAKTAKAPKAKAKVAKRPKAKSVKRPKAKTRAKLSKAEVKAMLSAKAHGHATPMAVVCVWRADRNEYWECDTVTHEWIRPCSP